jgi:hypothetical protein
MLKRALAKTNISRRKTPKVTYQRMQFLVMLAVDATVSLFKPTIRNFLARRFAPGWQGFTASSLRI